MEVCRACLLTENDMIPLNESFVDNYNLLTNLNVTLCDSMPQFSCLNCVELLKCFIEFRDKCISSETTLKEVVQNIKPDDFHLHLEIKPRSDEKNVLKQEIKIELPDNSPTLDDFSDHYNDDDKTEFNVKLELEGSEDSQNSYADVNVGKLRCSKRIKKCAEKKKVKKVEIELKEITKGVKPRKGKKKHEELIDKFLSCGLCKTKFEEKNDLKSHLETHMTSKTCDICQELFQTWQRLLAHRMQHLAKDEKRCHICDKRQLSCEHLEFHYLSVHGDGQKAFLTCKFCGKPYGTPRKLNKHVWSSHGEQRGRKYVCDYCSKSFSAKSTMTNHIRLKHTNERPYVCDLCGFRSKTKSNQQVHIAKHSLEKVTCKDCKRLFVNKEAHDKHTCNVKSFICPICGKLIPNARITRYKRHMATHDPEKQFKCDRCPQTFRGRPALRAHLDRHDENRSQKCEVCPARFYTRSSLIRHRRIHTGEKPYCCEVCSRKFTSNSILKMHLKVHGIFVINHRNKDPVTEAI